MVVIGYGTQRKGDVTSSVASVKADNFVKGAVKDVGQLIQGKVAGLAITNPNGDPTGSTQIRLRGTNTIGGANTAPLVLIDGIPGELGTVAPERCGERGRAEGWFCCRYLWYARYEWCDFNYYQTG